MTNDEQQVCEAAQRFYDAIETMMTGGGLDPMRAAWHHTDHVTSGHPSGDWAEGWDEVFATWEVFAGFGGPDRGGSRIENLKAHVYGDVAYTTCTFFVAPTLGGEALSCTNVFWRKDGAWKVVHHHVDKAPGMAVALEKIAGGG